MSKSQMRFLSRKSGSLTSNYGGKPRKGNSKKWSTRKKLDLKYLKQADNIEPIIKKMKQIMEKKPHTLRAICMQASPQKKTYIVKMYVTIQQ